MGWGRMLLLGNVGQIQEVGERASQWNSGVYRQLLELGGECLKIAIVACARRLGHRANALDGFEQLRALVRSQRVPEKLPEQPHVLPQRFVRIGLHGGCRSA